MYSLNPGFRIPAIQSGLSRTELLLTKATAGVGGALAASALLTPPPFWTFGAVGAAAGLLNLTPGPRSIGRWAAIGYRHKRERTVPAAMYGSPGETETWALYPDHGTMQDPHRRADWHTAFARALTFAGGQARTAGIQVHATHHATVADYTTHTQTLSVHVPRALMSDATRVLDTLEGEFDALGALSLVEPDPVPEVVERGPGWVGLDDGRYARTARITGWPAETAGDLMAHLLLDADTDRSIGVLYRPLPAGQSRRAQRLQEAANGAFNTDSIKEEAAALASDARRSALVQGDCLVDIDAYLTVWADDPDTVMAQGRQTDIALSRFRLDWLTGQQHRAHVMTTAHGASTTKGAIL